MVRMVILAFDTTSAWGGAAVYRGRECLASVPNPGPANSFSVTLFQMAERALNEAQLEFHDVELYAAANGPGSFTGIRVGLAAAQGWARALHRPARGVSVLEAMVEEARPEAQCVTPILNARRGEFFLRAFRRSAEHAGWVADEEGLALKPDALRSYLEGLARREGAEGAVACLVRAEDLVAQELKETMPGSVRWQTVSGPLLSSIARLALRAYGETGSEPAPALEACYIRRPDAEILFQSKT